MTSPIPNFRSLAPVLPGTIARSGDQLPAVMTEIWTTQGYGTAIGGFLKIIDPDVYLARVGGFLPTGSIPIAATGLADVVAWDTNLGAATVLRFRHGIGEGLSSNLEGLFTFMTDKFILDDALVASQYFEAVKLHGEPTYSECFGYVPLLALGGFEDARHLEKMDLLTHIELIGTLVAPVFF